MAHPWNVAEPKMEMTKVLLSITVGRLVDSFKVTAKERFKFLNLFSQVFTSNPKIKLKDCKTSWLQISSTKMALNS
jgi:hypothetical protein